MYRDKLDEFVEWWRAQPHQQEFVVAVAELRMLEPKTLNNARGFYIPEYASADDYPKQFNEELFDTGLKIRHNAGRFVLPVIGVDGKTMGFQSYTNEGVDIDLAEDEFYIPKYQNSNTPFYRARRTTVYGMENMRKYYTDGYCFFVEGIMCALWLREKGFNALAFLGSDTTTYVREIISRFQNPVIIPDNDQSGSKFRTKLRFQLPNVKVLQPRGAKDTDDLRKVAGVEDTLLLDLRNMSNGNFYALQHYW